MGIQKIFLFEINNIYLLKNKDGYKELHKTYNNLH